MSEQPQIRLVSRSRYALLLSKWLLCFELALMSSILGAGLMVLALYHLVLQFAIFCHAPIEAESETPFHGPWVLLIILVGGALALAGRKLFAGTQSGVPFTPVTPHNTHLLPAAESLVRASTLSPQGQQAELLRAATDGQDTPQDQLLRATQPCSIDEISKETSGVSGEFVRGGLADFPPIEKDGP